MSVPVRSWNTLSGVTDELEKICEADPGVLGSWQDGTGNWWVSDQTMSNIDKVCVEAVKSMVRDDYAARGVIAGELLERWNAESLCEVAEFLRELGSIVDPRTFRLSDLTEALELSPPRKDLQPVKGFTDEERVWLDAHPCECADCAPVSEEERA
jgi:hypothetical protein